MFEAQIIHKRSLCSGGLLRTIPLLKMIAGSLQPARSPMPIAYQQQFGARLRNPLEPQTCFAWQKDFARHTKVDRSSAPCRFVGETIRQLRELVGIGRGKVSLPAGCRFCRPGCAGGCIT